MGSHEWTKHGTCCHTTPGLESQLAFVKAALSLREKAGILAAFTAAGIKPGASYSYATMASAINSTLGHAPLLGCKGGALNEIGLCYDRQTMQGIECDDSVKHQQG